MRHLKCMRQSSHRIHRWPWWAAVVEQERRWCNSCGAVLNGRCAGSRKEGATMARLGASRRVCNSVLRDSEGECADIHGGEW